MVSFSKLDISENSKPLSAVIVLHKQSRLTSLNVFNHTCSVSFTSVARAEGHHKATYNLLLRSSKELQTCSVFLMVLKEPTRCLSYVARPELAKYTS